MFAITNYTAEGFMAVPCKECKEHYEKEEMHFGLCEDCYSDFQSMDLEDRLEKAIAYD